MNRPAMTECRWVRPRASGVSRAAARIVLLLAVIAPIRAQSPAVTPSVVDLAAELPFDEAAARAIAAGQTVTTPVVPVGDGELAIGLACLTRNAGAIRFAPVHAGHWLVPDDAIAAAGTLDDHAAEPLAGALAHVLSGTEGRRYARAQPGTDLNLAPAELAQLAATTAQGTSPARSAVVRDLALARYRAYRSSGLAGLAPYARSRGATMDPGAALRRSTLESLGVQKYFGPMHATLLNYPRVEPAVRDEGMHWIVARLGQRDTLLLTHSLAYHDGVAEIRAARALYVSQGLNATQAVTVVYPVAEGTLFMYVYRAWIDRTQVAGNSFAGRVARDLLTREMRELSRQTGTCS